MESIKHSPWQRHQERDAMPEALADAHPEPVPEALPQAAPDALAMLAQPT